MEPTLKTLSNIVEDRIKNIELCCMCHDVQMNQFFFRMAYLNAWLTSFVGYTLLCIAF